MQRDTTPPAWIVELAPGHATVSILAQPPVFECLPEAVRTKARKGEPYRFPLDLVIEPTSQFGKRARVAAATPGGAHFEIHSDEGAMLGGQAAAPTPLAYFMAGAGFCLMTHITGYLRFTELQISRLRIEMRANFHTTLGHVERGNQGIGGCDSIETLVIVDSDEPADKLQAFIAVCEEACIASQTLAKAIPGSVTLIQNGVIQNGGTQ